MKNRNSALSTNQITPGTQVNGTTGKGGSQPPRNRIVPMAHMVAMAMYSPRKNSRNGVEEYSTAKPATSSDSASAETKKMTNIGNSGSQNQLSRPYLPICASTIADRLSEPANSSTVIMTKPIETS